MINKQLKRQLNGYFGSIDTAPIEIQQFTNAISDHYDHLESKIRMLERSLEITTNEYLEYTQALILKEEHLKTTQRIAGVGSWEVILKNKENTWQNNATWSDEAYRIFGLQPGEIEINEASFTAMVHPDDRELVAAAFVNAIKENKPYEIEHRILLPDGEIRTVLEKAIIQTDPNTGEPAKVIGSVLDITELKKINEKVLTSEAHLKASQKIAQIGSWELTFEHLDDVNKNDLIWSDETFRIFGHTPHEVEVSNDLFIANVHPDDRQKVSAAFDHAIKTGEEYNVEHRIVLKNGHMKSLLERGIIEYDPTTKKPIKIIGTVQDITEWKTLQEKILNSETHLKASQRISKTGSWETELISLENRSGNPITWTDESYRIFGIKPGEKEITHDVFYSLIHPEDKQKVLIAFETAIQSKSEYKAEFRIITPAGVHKTVFEKGEITLDPITQLPQKATGTIQDVTEWKTLQEKILNSETHLNASQRIAKIGSWEVDIVDIENYMANPLYWSEETYRIFGVNPENAINNSSRFINLIHPDDLADVIQAFTISTEKGLPLNIEHRIITPGGVDKIVSQRSEVIMDPTGTKAIKIRGTTQDITQQKTAEISLKKVEANLRVLLENTDTAYVLMDTDGNVLVYNQLAKDLAKQLNGTGLGVGKKYADIMPPKRRDDVRQNIETVLNTKQPLMFEVNYSLYTDLKKWMYVRMFPVTNDSGQVIGISMSARDITQSKINEQIIKESNERYNMVRNATNDVIWDWDLETNTFFRSDNYKQVFGYPTTTDNVLWLTRVHPEDRELVEQGVSKKIKDPNARKWEQEYRFYKQSGELAYVQDKAYIIRDENNKPIRMVGAMQDNTQRKLAEIELNKLTNDLVQRNTDLEQFAYIVSHNLRAPLANIIGFTDTLITDSTNLTDKGYFLEALSHSVKKLDEVITDLNTILSVKREINERKELVNFKEITYDVIVSIYSSISKEGIRITEDFSQIVEFTTIKSYIYSIFYNLISNAIKYRNPDVESTLEIKSKLKNGIIQISFRDNGLGIDLSKKSQQVFGLYKRFHKQVEGKGMGLYMVKTQVETLGGKISITSEPNKGTEFIIEFEYE